MEDELIYKYVPFSINSLKLLIKGELWFGFPKNLNDPYEGEFLIKEYYNIPQNSLIEFYYKNHPELLNGESIETKLDNILLNYSVFHNDVHAILKGRLKEHYGVSSFSYDQKSILMWSHYSDSHKGFCIIFNKKELLESLKYPFTDFYDIDYKPNLCTAELMLEQKKIGYKNEKEVLYRKLDIWQGEQETRMIAFFKPDNLRRNIKFNKSCIKGIITGENISDDDKYTLQKLVENDSEFVNVKFYSATKNLKNKTMDIE